VSKNPFNKRVLIITGKGGVGKTTLAATLALAARDIGKKVLLVEIGSTPNPGRLFGIQVPVYREVMIESGLWVMSLDPYLALEEYLLSTIKIKTIVNFFMENQVIRYLTQAAPGWRELITIGKVWQLERQTEGYKQRPRYDLLVVDAPATGHGISFLRVPQVILNTLKFGPIKQQTLEVQKLLLDPMRTMMICVCLPEEMPVNESLEIYNAAREILNISFGYFVVNMVTSPLAGDRTEKHLDEIAALFGPDAEGIKKAAKMCKARVELESPYIQRLAQTPGAGILTVPRIYKPFLDRDDVGYLTSILIDQFKQAGVI